MKRREFIRLLGGAAVLAARGARAAARCRWSGSSAAHRTDGAVCQVACVPRRPERSRLHRGPERCDRVSLGGGPKRSVAGAGGRSGPPQVDVIVAGGGTAALGGQGGDDDDPDRLQLAADPVAGGTGRQPQPAWRQPHGRQQPERGAGSRSGWRLLRELVPTATSSRSSSTRSIPAPRIRCRRCGRRRTPRASRSMSCMRAVERDIDAAFATLVQQRAGALVVSRRIVLVRQREQLVALAARHAVPAIYPDRGVCRGRRPHELRRQPHGRVSSGRASTPAGFSRAKSRPICRSAVDQGRAGHQPQDRQGARARRAARRCSAAPTK